MRTRQRSRLAGSSDLGSGESLKEPLGLERLVPRIPGLETCIGIHDAVAPVQAQDALASILLGKVHILTVAIDMKLRQPHRVVVFQPRNRPPFTTLEFGIRLMDRIPTHVVVQGRELASPIRRVLGLRIMSRNLG